MARKKQRRRRSAATRPARFPSWSDIWHVFAIWIIPVQFWAAYKFFQELAPLSLRVNVWDLLGIYAYGQSVVLLESLFLTALFVAAAVLLPAGWYRQRFVAQSFIFVLVTASWAAIAHTFISYFVAMSTGSLLLYFIVYLVSLALPAYALLQENVRRRRPAWAETFLTNLAARLSPLSALYAALGILSLLVVLLRNLGIG